jgi:hypothetical protein
MTRKTGIELRKEHQNLQEKTTALEARIKNRLKELLITHPDAVIGTTSDNVQLKAKGLDNPYYLNNMSIDSTLQYIEIIERWLAKQHPHQQGELFN